MKPEDIQKVVQWINTKRKNYTCEICHGINWELGNSVVTPTTISNGVLQTFGTQATPQVMLICTNCGNTKYFNAVKIGLFNPAIKPTDTQEGK
jgi:hypothetical protein